jgi:hypothetical protein
MLIFSRKHFSSGNYKVYAFFIHLAIYFRAFIALAQRLVSRIYLPLIDSILLFLGFAVIVPIWEKLMFEPGYYPDRFYNYIIPVYVILWLIGIQLSGGYRKAVSILRVVRGLLWGTIAILVFYSLIDEEYRFSRALILFGALWGFIVLPAIRVLFSRLQLKGFELDIERQKRIAIVGHKKESLRVRDLLHLTPVNPVVVGIIGVDDLNRSDDYLGGAEQLKEIIHVNRIDEIIFCAESLSSGEIIRSMLDLSSMDVSYKIAPPESYSIIGSNSIHTAGDLYLVNVNAISKSPNRRKKRLFDFLLALFMLLTLPVSVWFYNNRKQLISNIFHVLSAKISWVGYIPDDYSNKNLPRLQPCVLDQSLIFRHDPPANQRKQLNILYAKDYRVWNDMALVTKNWKNLDHYPHE